MNARPPSFAFPRRQPHFHNSFAGNGMPKTTPLARMLRRLEIPECGCPVKWMPLCAVTDRRGCAERQRRGACDCPRAPDAPCQHILSINPETFPYTLDEWADLLGFLNPAEYADPSPPAPLGDVVSRQARVAVMELRHPRQHLYHSADEWRREDWVIDRLGQMLRQRVNGRPAAGELAIECEQEAA